MAGWEKARRKLELDQEQAARRTYQGPYNTVAENAVERLVSELDPRVRQFVQTLHDHNQWPGISREITEKKGLLWTRFEKKTVTEPSTVDIECSVKNPRYGGITDYRRYIDMVSYRLKIFSSQEWRFSGFDSDEYGYGRGCSYTIVSPDRQGNAGGT